MQGNFMEYKTIKEVIIVEGKDDITKLSEGINGTIVQTGGIHISKTKMEEIKALTKNRGAIILTDPDHAGNVIREKLIKNLDCPIKIAYLKRKLAIKNGDIGVENADIADIIEAINNARPTYIDAKKSFDEKFLFDNKLTGFPDSKKRREFLSEKLNLGEPNAKALLKRLNNFEIEKGEVLEILEEYRG